MQKVGIGLFNIEYLETGLDHSEMIVLHDCLQSLNAFSHESSALKKQRKNYFQGQTLFNHFGSQYELLAATCSMKVSLDAATFPFLEQCSVMLEVSRDYRIIYDTHFRHITVIREYVEQLHSLAYYAFLIVHRLEAFETNTALVGQNTLYGQYLCEEMHLIEDMVRITATLVEDMLSLEERKTPDEDALVGWNDMMKSFFWSYQEKTERLIAWWRVFEDAIQWQRYLIRQQSHALRVGLQAHDAVTLGSILMPLTDSLCNEAFVHCIESYVQLIRSFFRKLLPANNAQDLDYILKNSYSDERLSLGVAAIDAMREGLDKLDCWRSPYYKNKCALIYIFAAMACMDFLEFNSDRSCAIKKKEKATLLGDFPRDRRSQRHWLNVSVDRIRCTLSSVEDSEENYRVIDWAYLEVLKMLLTIHESHAWIEYLRFDVKLSLGDRYGEFSRIVIAEFLCEAVQHIQSRYTTHATSSYSKSCGGPIFDESAFSIESTGPFEVPIGWRFFDDDELPLLQNDNECTDSDCYVESSPSESCTEKTDEESDASDDISGDDETLQQAMSSFYSEYYFWIESMLHIEVMHVERIRAVQSSLNNTILKEANREQIESEHLRLFADQKLRQDRVFIMRNFMIYYEIGKLLSSSTTTNRQALRLIQTIVREDNMVVKAKTIVREIAHQFKVCNV
jgi:hypothetical protein